MMDWTWTEDPSGLTRRHTASFAGTELPVYIVEHRRWPREEPAIYVTCHEPPMQMHASSMEQAKEIYVFMAAKGAREAASKFLTIADSMTGWAAYAAGQRIINDYADAHAIPQELRITAG